MNDDDTERHRTESFAAFTEFQRTGRTASLDEAVSHGEALISAQSLDLLDLHNLIEALLTRWQTVGSRIDLDRAAALMLPLLPAIGQVLTVRGLADRCEADLVTAVECLRHALSDTDGEFAPLIKLNLAQALHTLGNLRSSDTELLEAAQLLAEADPDSTDHYQRLLIVQAVASLALDINRITGLDYEWDGLAADLRSAIEANAPALELADSWSNLALLYHLSYLSSAEQRSIEHAVEAAQYAVNAADGRAETLAERLHVLACAERTLAASTQDAEHLAEAERHVRQAIDLATATAQPSYLDTLASILLLRSQLEHDPDRRREALQASREVAIEHSESEASLPAALRWAAIAAEDRDWHEGMRAFDVAAARTKQSFRNLRWLASQVSWLEDRGRWSSAAAVTAANAGEPTRGIEMLEHVRGMLLGQSQSDISATAVNLPTSPAAPVIYLCSSPFGGAAIVVTNDTVRAIDLPVLAVNESPNGVKARLTEYLDAYDDARFGLSIKRWTEVLDELLNWAGEEVMAKVLDAVGAVQEAYLVPAGPLTFVPWHAAWVADNRAPLRRRYVIDEVELSCVPTMSALAGSVPPDPGRAPVAVCEPRPTTGLRPLPTAALEVDAVRAALPTVRVLAGQDCSRDAVLRELRTASIAHLACHAIAPPWAPLASHLVMANDEQLTVSDLLAERTEIGLVVMSACETGIGGRLLADEALTLANALVVGGAQAAIGSLWIAPDAATTAVMIRFYELWVTEKLTARHALCASQRWLRDTPAQEVARHLSNQFTGEQRQLLHDGLSHPDLPHTHPAAWAPFVYAGT